MRIFSFIIILFFTFGCVGTQIENKVHKSSIENKNVYLQSFNICNKKNINKVYMLADGSILFLDLYSSPIQKINFLTGEVFCHPNLPEKYLDLSMSEAKNILIANDRIISKETRLVVNSTLKEVRDKIGKKCKEIGLSTVFLVDKREASLIIGCQKTPEARQAIMTELIQENNNIKVNMMWPQSLSIYTRLIAKILS